MRNKEVKFKVVNCDKTTNQIVLQSNTSTLVIESPELLEFLLTATTFKRNQRKTNEIQEQIAKEILQHLNNRAGKRFEANESNLKFIFDRLNAGETPEMLKKIIDVKTWEWLENMKMKKFLRPETLFNATKFQSYKQEVLEIEENPEAFKKFVTEKHNERNSKDYDNLDELIASSN